MTNDRKINKIFGGGFAAVMVFAVVAALFSSGSAYATDKKNIADAANLADQIIDQLANSTSIGTSESGSNNGNLVDDLNDNGNSQGQNSNQTISPELISPPIGDFTTTAPN